jgi:hypothetical protein
MTYAITPSQDGVLRLRISGLMQVADQRGIQALVSSLPADDGGLRVVAELEDFRGWEKDEAWGDLGFLLANGHRIARMAVVGEERWRERALLFVGKGFRSTDIEYFPGARDAEDWVRG